jgi:DNA-binding LacI/PurR family transcriptional regulator
MLEEENLLRARPNGEWVVQPHDPETVHPAARGSVAVFMPDVPEPGHTQSGWAEVVGQGAIAVLRRSAGSAMVLAPPRFNDQTLDQFRKGPPAGVVIADLVRDRQELDDLAAMTADLPCPVVVYGGHPRWNSFDRIVSDHAHGCAALYRFLWQRGRRRILLLMPEPDPATQHWVDQRIVGYDRVVHESAAAYHKLVRVPPGPNATHRADGFDDAARHLLGYLGEYVTGPDAADAVMCASDGQVFAAAAACRKINIEPGRDLDIVGYDNYWQDNPERQFEPYQPPATVDKQNHRIGEQMVQLLRDRIEGRLDVSPCVRIVEPELIVTQEGV